ncbi:methyltransferase domain-containing protein [Polymorphobacter fuscus]|uniref:Methyltransferase domain-containing protein n=1 Tax=Sandarakinorhabdus fusca TaxID=1439888 RepID=A0A7C9GVC8_9SPHN|nr:class I SAM-dependent methyltransferase [Polymorphobacter fuscus]KAB7647912.1 methyltransferase domain-containing protein [Polymorphobacter fuscus]MQT17229.1 methyltransferase domain-containing protein [Polymorphobacter fuscus]NJC08777.1 SAM-dependent methyltransferase [Polymorphobacter fuscus]
MVKIMENVRMVQALLNPSDRMFLKAALVAHEKRPEADCPCCGFHGKFESTGLRLRLDARCPSCGALERHRLLALSMARGFVDFHGKDVLHFAPDAIIVKMVADQGPTCNETADLEPGRADRILNIEALALPDASLDRIICSHVLEHVDDQRALAEMWRVLRPGGAIVIMMPVIEAWRETYENDVIGTPAERERHFGQWDHLRWFGADVRQRIRAQKFECREFVAGGPDSASHNLIRGETVFLAVKL